MLVVIWLCTVREGISRSGFSAVPDRRRRWRWCTLLDNLLLQWLPSRKHHSTSAGDRWGPFFFLNDKMKHFDVIRHREWCGTEGGRGRWNAMGRPRWPPNTNDDEDDVIMSFDTLPGLKDVSWMCHHAGRNHCRACCVCHGPFCRFNAGLC